MRKFAAEKQRRDMSRLPLHQVRTVALPKVRPFLTVAVRKPLKNY